MHDRSLLIAQSGKYCGKHDLVDYFILPSSISVSNLFF